MDSQSMVRENREDAYPCTGSIFIRDMAHSLWFNEVWPYASLNHNEYAVSRMKMPPVREYASSLMLPKVSLMWVGAGIYHTNWPKT